MRSEKSTLGWGQTSENGEPKDEKSCCVDLPPRDDFGTLQADSPSTKESSFFAMVMRMKYIRRWGLMRNTREENLSEHSLDVAMIVHALGMLHNTRFGGQINVERLALLGLYHDVNEIITGDLPTPVKYHDEQIRQAYKQVEALAAERLVDLLPDDLQEAYRGLLGPEDPVSLRFLKAADKLSALIKCIEEENAGNHEFAKAKEAQLEAIHALDCPEAEMFMTEFLGSFSKTLDEQG